MYSKRRLSRGFAVAYVVAGIGMAVGLGYLATNTLISLMGSSQSVNAQSETINKLNVLVAELNKQSSDVDNDSIYEAISPTDFVDNETSLTGGGKIPKDTASIVTDGWGQPLVYCAWDYGLTSVATGFETDYGDGNEYAVSDVTTAMPLYAIISSGPDKARATTCANAKDKSAKADDIVKLVLVGDVQSQKAAGVETCVDDDGNPLENTYNAFDPETGKFVCRTLDVEAEQITQGQTCPGGQVWNGYTCSKPISHERKYVNQRHTRLYLDTITSIDFWAENYLQYQAFYSDIDLKDGVLVISSNNYVECNPDDRVFTCDYGGSPANCTIDGHENCTWGDEIDLSGDKVTERSQNLEFWVRNNNDGTWSKGAEYVNPSQGRFGYTVNILTNKNSKYANRPQLLVGIGADRTSSEGSILHYNLYDTMASRRMEVNTATKDFGFIQDISFASLAGPQSLSNFESSFYEPLNNASNPYLLNIATGVAQPDGFQVWEGHTEDTIRTVIAVSNSAFSAYPTGSACRNHNTNAIGSNCGQVRIYEANTDDYTFNFKQDIYPPDRVAEQRFGRDLDIDGKWLAVKNHPIFGQIPTSGRTYLYNRTGDNLSNNFAATPTYTFEALNGAGDNNPTNMDNDFSFESPDAPGIIHPVDNTAFVKNYLIYPNTMSRRVHLKTFDTPFAHPGTSGIYGWLALGEPENKKITKAHITKVNEANVSHPSAGAVTVYRLSYSGATPAWNLHQQIYSPYRGSEMMQEDPATPGSDVPATHLGHGYSPLANQFGAAVALGRDKLMVSELGYGISYIDYDNSMRDQYTNKKIQHSSEGVVYVYNVDNISGFGSAWTPRNVKANHFLPFDYSNFPGANNQGFWMRTVTYGSIAFDEDSGDVGLHGFVAGFGNPNQQSLCADYENTDCPAFDPASPGNAFAANGNMFQLSYVDIYSNYENDKVFFVDYADTDQTTEVCPNPRRPIGREFIANFPGKPYTNLFNGDNTPNLAALKLTRAANCFEDYDPVNNVWVDTPYDKYPDDKCFPTEDPGEDCW